MKKILLFLILSGLVLLPLLPAQAQTGAISPSLGISPPLVQLTMRAGESKDVKITLKNYGGDPIPLGVSKLNISGITRAGAPEFTENPTTRSAESWLEAEKTDFIVEANNSESIFVTVKVPTTAAPGGYTAALVFQAKLPSYYFDLDANTRVLPALSASFLVSVEQPVAAHIQPLSITRLSVPQLAISSPVAASVTIRNPGDFFIYTNVELTVTSLTRKKTNLLNLKGSVIMPESTREYLSTFSSSFWPGLYKVEAKVDQGDNLPILTRSARFLLIPWQFGLALISLVCLLIVILGRRRFRRAFGVLIGHHQIIE